MLDGWLINVPFYNPLVFVAAVILGFIQNWWGGLVVIACAMMLAGLTKVVFGRPVFHYLALIHHKMVNRAADYKAKNDAERAAACETYCQALEQLMLIYQGTGLKPPTRRQLKEVPYGDLYYWLNRGERG